VLLTVEEEKALLAIFLSRDAARDAHHMGVLHTLVMKLYDRQQIRDNPLTS
jgi:hypothetical protein